MPEPVSTAVAIGIASGLATEAIMKFGQWLKESNAGREVRKQLGFGSLHSKVKKVLETAIYEASRVPQLDAALVRAFTEAETNRQILVQWIWDPSRIELTRDQLDRSCAVTRKERANLDRFIKCLPEALDQARQEIFDPETWTVIQQVTGTVRREHSTTRGHVTSEHEKTREELDPIRRELAAVRSELQASNEEIVLERIEESVRADLEEARLLLEQHRVQDALALARRSLEKIERENLSNEARRAAHERMANGYLSTTHRQDEAIDHLEAIAELTSERDVCLRNRALASLLRGEIDTGLDLIEDVLDEKPNDPNAALIKANLLAARGDNEQAADFYVEIADPEDINHLYNLGALELQAGRFEQARHRALQILEAEDNANAHTLFGVSVVLERHEQVERGEIQLSSDMGKLLHEAHEHLNDAIGLYSDQRPGRASFAFFYRGALRIWLDAPREALTDLRRSHEIDTNEQTLHNLTLLSYQLGDVGAGLKYLEQLKGVQEDTETTQLLYLESILLAKDGRSEEAVTLLEDHLAADRIDDRLPVQLLLARAYDRNLEPGKADGLLEELESDYPDDPRVHLEKGTRAQQRGDLDRAVRSFRQAAETSSGKLRAKAETFLAEALFQRGTNNASEEDLEEAAHVFGKLATPEVNDHYLRQLALSLFRLGRFTECIDLCEAAQQEKRIPLLTELEARIYEIHENYEQAAKRYKWLAETTEGDVNALLKYGNCQYLLGRVEEARDAVDMAANRISDDAPYEHLVVSRAYVASGELTKGVHHAYTALTLGEEKALYHQQYIGLFISHGEEIKAQEAAADEHIEAFQRSISEYEARFPESPFVRAMEPPEDPEELLDQLREQMPSADAIEAQERLFVESDLPVGSLAKATGKSVAATWLALTGHPDCGIASDEGSRELLEQEVKTASASNAVLLDLPPLLTLQHLGLLDILPQAFDGIYVPQAVFNELRETIERERSRSGKERMSLRPTRDGISVSKVPAGEGDRWLESLQQVRDFIASDDVTLIGQSIDRDEIAKQISDAHPADAHDLLGRPTAEALSESKVQGLTLYAEDRVVRRLARSENVDSFGTRALLRALLDRELISAFTYHDAVIELIRLGHYFPFVTFGTLAYGAQRDGFLPTRSGTSALKALESPNNDTYSLLHIGTQFLAWLWGTHEGRAFRVDKPSLTVQWTWNLLDAVAPTEERLVLAATLRKIMLDYVFPNFPSSQRDVRGFHKAFDIWWSRKGVTDGE